MLKRSYLLLGPELGERRAYIAGIKEEIQARHGDAVEEYSYYPYDAGISDAITAAESLSMFSSFTLIQIHDCAELKKKDLDLFLEYLKKPADDTVIIFVDSGMKADAKLRKAVEEEKIFWELSEPQRRSYVQSYFRRLGIPVDSDAAAFIAANCENNTLAVKNECDKLALFFEGGEPVTLDAVEEILFNGREESVFSLFDQLLTTDLEKAAGTARNLMLSSDGNPIQLLGGLVWQLRRLAGVRTLLDDGVPIADACRKNGITTKRGQTTHAAGAQRYSIEDLERIMALCATYDELFRSVRTEMQESLFLVFLYELMVKKGHHLCSAHHAETTL